MSTVIPNPDAFRANMRGRLADRFGFDAFSAANLEIGVFNCAIAEAASQKIVKKWTNPLFEQIYINRLRSVHANMCRPEIARRVVGPDADWLPQEFAFMSHIQMDPERWTPLLAKKTKRDALAFETHEHATTSLFTCGKCKSTKCSHYEMQTRSADEPMTIFIQCLDCGKRWKQ
jgi:DNA-directed RNA polymerase subunit M/transcription elongation factor TFIIS